MKSEEIKFYSKSAVISATLSRKLLMKKTLISTTVLLGAVFMVSGVHAATKVVSKWGTDISSCGPGSTPCRTIGWGISQASANDTVLVHPGVYTENLIIDSSKSGLQLTSLSGRSATAIVSANSSSNVITVNAINVRIGSKANGFSIEGGGRRS